MADPTTASTYTAVDLSRLPAPAVIETLSFEDSYAELAALVQITQPDFDPTDETNPAVAVLQVAAYHSMGLRARVNDAARAVMVAYAQKSDLDNLGAVFQTARLQITPADPETQTPAVMESDTDYRRRLVLAPEGYSVAGPEGAYIFHTLSADPRVLDASATSPEPGVVEVSVLSREAGGLASPDLCNVVAAYVSAETRRPLTDNVIVKSASVTGYAIDADVTTFAGPDRTIVLAQSQVQVAAYVAESFRLGRDINRASIIAAIFCPGIQNIVLNSPAEDMIFDRTQAGFCTSAALNYVGTGE